MPRRPFFHVSIVVQDIKAAMAELSGLLGVRWREPRARRYGRWKIKAVYSKGPPPWLELIQGEAGGPWDASRGPRLDHISYYSDDVAAESDRLVEAGFPIDFCPTSEGLPKTFVYHRGPATNLRVELSPASRKAEHEAVHAAEVEAGGPPPPEPFFHVGLLVQDLDASMAELTRALGVKWRVPHESRYADWPIRVVYSRGAPPFIELIQGGPGGPWDASGGSHLNHIGVYADDVAAAKARLAASGAPIDFDPARIGRGQAFCYHRAPLSGVRLELLAETSRQHNARYTSEEDVADGPT